MTIYFQGLEKQKWKLENMKQNKTTPNKPTNHQNKTKQTNIKPAQNQNKQTNLHQTTTEN